MAYKIPPKGKRGRPKGPPKDSKLIGLELRQIQQLNALIEITRGKPSFTALVRHAVDFFLDAEMAKPGVRQEMKEYLVKNRRSGLKVVRGNEK